MRRFSKSLAMVSLMSLTGVSVAQAGTIGLIGPFFGSNSGTIGLIAPFEPGSNPLHCPPGSLVGPNGNSCGITVIRQGPVSAGPVASNPTPAPVPVASNPAINPAGGGPVSGPVGGSPGTAPVTLPSAPTAPATAPVLDARDLRCHISAVVQYSSYRNGQYGYGGPITTWILDGQRVGGGGLYDSFYAKTDSEAQAACKKILQNSIDDMNRNNGSRDLGKCVGHTFVNDGCTIKHV